MLINDLQYEQARERREREHAERVRERMLQRRPASVRRAVGRSMISIGSRLASEPQHPRLARSR